jgi:hypothetical protein
MSVTYINGSYASYYLTSTTTLAIGPLGTLAGGLGAPSDTTILSQGSITSSGTAVLLQQGDVFENNGTASLVEGQWGIDLAGAGLVANQGTILGDGGTAIDAAGGGVTITNSGAASLIEGATGIDLSGGGTVVNYGTIEGTSASALVFRSANSVLKIEGGSTLVGAVSGNGDSTLELAGDAGAGTVAGLGSHYTGFSLVEVLSGATWTLDGTDTVGSLVNGGALYGEITLSGGGYLTNEAGATLSGMAGAVYGASGGSGTVSNSGVIDGGSGSGVDLVGGGSVSNATTISLIESTGPAVYLASAGTVTNLGTILSTGGGGIRMLSSGIVTNTGTASLIEGHGYGVFILGDGTVTNHGEIDGAVGIEGGGTTSGLTVFNYGTIDGSGGTSVLFNSTGDVLVVEAGGTLDGVAYGGGGTLRLAGNAGAGTLTGLGVDFVDFSEIKVASGATWTLQGANTVASGTTLSNGGTLTVIGSLENAGSIAGGIRLLAGGALLNDTGATISNTGTAVRGNGATTDTVTNDGYIAGTGAGGTGIYFKATALILNDIDATIYGSAIGVSVASGGTVTNFGTISGGTDGFAAGAATIAGSVVPTGLLNYGEVISDSGTAVYLKGYGYVVNDAAGLIEGYDAGVVLADGGVVGNYGTIEAIGQDFSVYGVSLNGAILLNGGTSDATALVAGYAAGVAIGTYGGAVYNYGTIESTAIADSTGIGVAMAGFGVVVNGPFGETAATILGGEWGVFATSGGGVANYGTIEATGPGGGDVGVYMRSGRDIVVNGPSGDTAALVEGVTAVVLEGYYVRLVNYGTLDGTGGTAVRFRSNGAVLKLEAGSKLIGAAEAGGSGVLELGAGGGAGTLSGLGGGTITSASVGTFGIGGFPYYMVEAGADWTLIGTNTLGAGDTLEVEGTLDVAGTLTLAGTAEIGADGRLEFASAVAGGTVDFLGTTGILALDVTAGVTLDIANFARGDLIDLTGVSYDSGHMTATYAAGTLGIFDGLTEIAEIAATGLAGDTFTLSSDGHAGTDVGIVCFLRGTRILTPRGEVPIEDLAPGDLVVTVSGEGPVLKPVRWIGRRRIDAARHREPERVYPVRIARGAFAEAVPHRDLWVSPPHALQVEGVLVSAGSLVNGASIVRDRDRQVFEYFHLELDRHDLVLAEGLVSETYLDCGNRRFFDTAEGPLELHGIPERGCAPRATRGPAVAEAKRRLGRRLEQLGYRLDRRAELRLELDGRRLDPVAVADGTYRFVLPRQAQDVVLVSAAAFPADTPDSRILGIAVLAVTVDGTPLDLADATLFRDGWHKLETARDRRWRWTDGSAALPARGPCMIEIRTGNPVLRWVAPEQWSAEAQGSGLR